MATIKRKLYILDKSYLDNDWQEYIKFMPIWRQEIINKFISNEPKKLSLISSLLFEIAMKEIDAKADVKNIKISYNKYGKPYIDEEKYKNIKFNISHSQEKAIIAIADEEVGCDIEKMHNIDINIAKRFFTQNEYELIRSVEDIENQKKLFYKIWTYKESYSKMIGKGLNIGLDTVDFSEIDYNKIFFDEEIKNGKPISFFNNGELYYFYNYDIEDYIISICTKEEKLFTIANIKNK